MTVRPDKKEHHRFCHFVKSLAEPSDSSPTISIELFTMAAQRLNLF